MDKQIKKDKPLMTLHESDLRKARYEGFISEVLYNMKKNRMTKEEEKELEELAKRI